jgi:RNA polymerase sigma factor (sigma-70 family)
MTISPVRFETLIERYHDEISSYLWRLTGSAADAEDLAQEVFLRAYQAYERLRPDSNHRAWLYKIARNCAYTALKRDKRHAQHSVTLDDSHETLADTDPSVHQQAALNETLATVRQAIAALPAKQREAIVLRHVQGLDYAEIAQVLGCSADSARANVYQALRRLRRELEDF